MPQTEHSSRWRIKRLTFDWANLRSKARLFKMNSRRSSSGRSSTQTHRHALHHVVQVMQVRLDAHRGGHLALVILLGLIISVKFFRFQLTGHTHSLSQFIGGFFFEELSLQTITWPLITARSSPRKIEHFYKTFFMTLSITQWAMPRSSHWLFFQLKLFFLQILTCS